MTHRPKTPWRWTWLLAALLCLLAVSTAWELSRLVAYLRFYAHELMPAYQSAHELSGRLQALRRLEYGHALASGGAERERLAQRMDELGEASLQQLDALERSGAPSAVELRHLRAVRSATAIYLQQCKRQRRASGAPPSDPRDLPVLATTSAFDDAQAALDAWWADDTQRAPSQEHRVDTDAERVLLGLLGMVGLALLLASGAVAGAAGSTTRVDPERWASF